MKFKIKNKKFFLNFLLGKKKNKKKKNFSLKILQNIKRNVVELILI